MSFSERFRNACINKQLLGKDIASKMDVSPNTISAYMTGRHSPSLEFIETFCSLYSVNLAWLAAGVSTDVSLDTEVIPSSIFMVPRFDVHASAGKGAAILDEEPIGHMAFQMEWINRMNLNPSQLIVIGVVGDSMNKVLEDGDSILVDRAVNDVLSGAVYVFRQDDELLVKYLQKMPGNLLRVSSENKSYPSYDIDMNVHTDSVQIIGRVACSMHAWL